MKIHSGVLAVLFISMIVIGATTFISSLEESYPARADFSEMNVTQQRIKEQNVIINDTYTNFQKLTLDKGASDNVFYQSYILLQVGWDSIRQFFGSWNILFAIIGDLANVLSLPAWFVGTVILLVMVSVVVILIYLAFKWKAEM